MLLLTLEFALTMHGWLNKRALKITMVVKKRKVRDEE